MFTFFLSKILMTFFSVIALFHDLHALFFFLTSSPPSMHTPTCCFTRFYTLLYALVTINTLETIYFFLIHHCTNSLSSLHIFVHHCTFCASLHTKTSPDRNCSHMVGIVGRANLVRGGDW